MKRLLRGCLLSALTLALAGPAWGYQVKIGARIDTDVGYVWRSGNSNGTPFAANDSRLPDLTTFYIAMPGTNYLRFEFTSNDKSTGARIEIGISAGGSDVWWGHGSSAVALRHMFGWYKFGRCRLVIGHTDNLFASLDYAPYQWLGRGNQIGIYSIIGPPGIAQSIGDNAPTYMFVGMGKQYSGRFVQIALYYDVGPWTFMASLGQAPTMTYWFRPVGVQFSGNNMLPRLDLVVRYRGKYISAAPGLSISQSELDPIEGGSLDDDRVLSYCLVLPVRLSFGAFKIKGEVSYGMNWVTANYAGAHRFLNMGAFWGGNNDPTRTKLEDTYFLAACLGLEYYLGRVSFHLGGGWQKTTNASNDQVGTWRHGQNVRYGFNFAVRYHVNKHFIIAPEISYWNYGWNPHRDVGDGNAMFADFGSAWLAGISFQVRF
jgi:hypothetical protein